MNIRKQILLDKYLAKPAGHLLNYMVRIMGQILRIDHRLDKEFKCIGICKFKGMGSILQATPMMDALRKRYPKAEIIFVSTIANRHILDTISLVDTTVLLDESTLWRFMISNIKALVYLIRKRPDVYIDLEIYSDFSTVFAALTLSTNRMGFYLRSSSFRMGIYTHMMYFNPREPISKVYLQFASLFTNRIDESSLYSFSETVKKFPAASDSYIVINPNASDLRLERRWGEANFITLINSLRQAFPVYQIQLIGSASEHAYTQAIADAVNDPFVKNTAGTQSIEELIAFISHAKLMISNDTGPMHIAFCTNTPIVCLFGPCSPEQYAHGGNVHVMYKKVYCSPCVHDFEVAPCHGNNICMKLIEPAEVFEKVKQALLNPAYSGDPIEDVTIRAYENETIGLIKR
jgi:hypothetical protein